MKETGTAVVFLHGIGGGAWAWTLQEPSFQRAGFHPVAIDLPGYGARPTVDVLDFAGLPEEPAH